MVLARLVSAFLSSTVKILGDLIGFDTTSRNTNLAMIDYIADHLSTLGIPSQKIYSDDQNKANLYATIGPKVDGGIVLSGHTDVVPVDGQNWATNPFELTTKQNKLYGRGTADMKGFIACCLAMAEPISQVDIKRPIHLAFSYDEEVGCIGVGRLIELIASQDPNPACVIVGEPTAMQIVNAHKGICVMSSIIRGREGHSSHPHRGVNAIEAAAALTTYIYELCDELSKIERDGRFEPPYTTFNTGVISGGDAVNIIARECTLNWEFRPIPGADHTAITARINNWVEEELLAKMRKVDPRCSIKTTREVLVPPFDQPNSVAEELVRKITGSNDAAAVAYVTEASLFSQASIPAVVIGPGNISQAHQPDEFISLDQLAKCLSFLNQLIELSVTRNSEKIT